MGTWKEETVGQTPFRIYEPSSANDHGATICFLHDEDQSNPFQDDSVEAHLEAHGLTVVAPVVGPLWSLDVETSRGLPREYMLDEVLRDANELAINAAPVDAAPVAESGKPHARLALCGLGMGGQAALRISYDYPDRFPIVAAIEPTIDFHLHVRVGHDVLSQQFSEEEAARQHTAILHVHPLNWPRHHFFCADPLNYPWFDGADRLRQKLAASGIQFDCELEESAEDFEETYFQMMANRVIEYCANGLQRERLRIV